MVALMRPVIRGKIQSQIDVPQRCVNSLGRDTTTLEVAMPNQYTGPSNPEQRFWAKVNKNGPLPDFAPHLGPCWLWTGSLTLAGYGHFQAKWKHFTGAHRFSYKLAFPDTNIDDLFMDHLCRVSACVNPSHLEPVTPAENVRRGLSGRLVTHCPKGHEYTAENTLLFYGKNRAGPSRNCRICHNAASIARRRPGPCDGRARHTYVKPGLPGIKQPTCQSCGAKNPEWGRRWRRGRAG